MKPIMLLAAMLLFACPEKVEAPKPPVEKGAITKKADTPKVVEKKVEEKEEKELGFVELKYEKKDRPESVKFLGKAKFGTRWQDRNGDNWFILSASRALHHGNSQIENLYATHVVIKDGEAKTLRTVKELKPECEFDWNASFEQRAVSILDTDDDGYGEITFAYRTTCTSDVSPNTYKLFVLENGVKNIFRGTDIIDAGEIIGDGKYKTDGFKDAKPLYEHAERVWKKTVRIKL